MKVACCLYALLSTCKISGSAQAAERVNGSALAWGRMRQTHHVSNQSIVREV